MRNYIEEDPDPGHDNAGKNPLMEAVAEKGQETDKNQEVGRVVLPGEDPLFITNPSHLSGIEVLRLLIEAGALNPGIGADHPEDRAAD